MWPTQPLPATQPLRPPLPSPAHPSINTTSILRTLTQVLHVSFFLLEAMISMRIVLRGLGADPNAGFSLLITGITGPFLMMFNRVFPLISTGVGTLELTSVLALIVYALLSSQVVILLGEIEFGRRTSVLALRIARGIHFLFGLLEALLGLRILLMAFGADPQAGFSSAIFGVTDPFLIFFRHIFPTISTGVGILDLSSVLALIVYAILSWGITSFIASFGNHPRAPSIIT
jgi:uncharacterized protein YggT (Ycf19 family)